MAPQRLLYLWIDIVLCVKCLVGAAFAQSPAVVIADSSYRLLPAADYHALLSNPIVEKGSGQSIKQNIDFGLTADHWHGAVVQLASSYWHGEVQFCIDNTSLDSVLIFEQEKPIGQSEPSEFFFSGHKEVYRERYRGGNAIPYNTFRQFVWHTFPIRRSAIPKKLLVLLKAPAQNINVRIEVLTNGALEKRHIAYERVIFGYLGCVAFIALCTLISYILLRQRVLLYYLAYIVCTAGWIISHYGYGYALFYPRFPALNAVVKPVMSLLAVYFVIALITELVPRLVERSWWRDLLQGFQLMALVFTLIAIGQLFSNFPLPAALLVNIGWHVIILGSIIALLGILVPIVRGDLAVKALSAGFGILLLMTLLQIFTNFIGVDWHRLSEHGLLFAQLAEMLLLAFGMVYRLFAERKEKEAALQTLDLQQRQTLRTLIGLQDSERKRIAQDLHDSIGPLLAAIKINFHRAGNTAKIAEEISELLSKTDLIIDESISEIRGIAHQLMPRGLSSKGLIVLLSDYFRDLEPLYRTQVVFGHRLEVSLPEEVQLNVYRMISELVLNAAKHSGAGCIQVAIETSAECCVIEVKDNGKGLPSYGPQRHVFGLAGMQRRVAYLQGKFAVDSHPSTGTTIRITIPLFIPT